jgi:hypothetical protein
MVSYPPGPATVSRAFLHEDDDCWAALTSADDATENLMKIEKFCQRANCHQKVSRWRRDTLGKGRRSRRGQSRRRWRQRWRSWRRQRQGETPCHRRRQLAIAKGADVSRLVSHAWLSASNCSWSSSSGGAGSDVLAISREYFDQTTGKNVDLPDLVLDVAKFCKTNGVKQSGYCWEFVAS